MADPKKNNHKKRGKSKRTIPPLYGPLHPWRICPIGEHWVRDYERSGQTNKKKPGGKISVRGYCRHNRTHRDLLYPDELNSIAQSFFSALTGPPDANDLGFAKGNEYDDLIRGWTKYWNDILQPSVLLDANLVKALVASESSFNPLADNHSKGAKKARGLMQVTESTRKILQDEAGELSEHFLTATGDETYEPNINIAMGIRWLFQKQVLLSKKSKRQATWEEAVSGFKALKPKSPVKSKARRSNTLYSRFEDFCKRLKKVSK
jgi:hypothetical protein